MNENPISEENNLVSTLNPSPDIRQVVNNFWSVVRKTVESYSATLNDNKEQKQKLSEIETKLLNLEQEYSDIQTKSANRIEEVGEYENFIEELSQENTTLTQEINRLKNIEEDLKQQKAAYEELQNKVKTYQSESTAVSSLMLVVEEEKKKTETLTRENIELKDKIFKLGEPEKNMTFLQSELVRKNYALHERAEEVKKLNNRIAELESCVHSQKEIENKLQAALNNYNNLNEKAMQLENDYGKLSEQLQSEQDLYKEQQAKYEEIINENKTALESQGLALQEFTDKILSLKIECKEYEEELKEALELKSIINEVLVAEKTKSSGLVTQLSELENLKEELLYKEKLNTDYIINIKSLETAKYNSEKIISELKILLSNYESQISEWELEKEALLAKIETIEEYTAQIEILESRIADYDSSNKMLKEQGLEKDKQLSENHKFISKLEDNLANLQANLNSLIKENDALKHYESKFLIINQENNTIKQQIKELSSKLNDVSYSIIEKDKKIGTISAANNELIDKASEYKKKISELETIIIHKEELLEHLGKKNYENNNLNNIDNEKRLNIVNKLENFIQKIEKELPQ